MLIVSNINGEGIYNLDNIIYLESRMLDSENATIYFTGVDAKPGYIGQWSSKEKAEMALDEIIKANHIGLREVYLHD